MHPPPVQPDRSFAEIMEIKRLNRERILRFVKEASPEALAASSERIKEILRRPDGLDQRRKRIAPPAFSTQDLD